MQNASLFDLKKGLFDKNPKELIEICIRLAKYKKENKELLDYVLNYNSNEFAFVQKAKNEITLHLALISKTNIRNAIKITRKAFRICLKNIKYSSNKQTEIELLLFFCSKLQTIFVKLHQIPVLNNLYERQILKIKKLINGFHPDLQYDYQQELENLLNQK